MIPEARYGESFRAFRRVVSVIGSGIRPAIGQVPALLVSSSSNVLLITTFAQSTCAGGSLRPVNSASVPQPQEHL